MENNISKKLNQIFPKSIEDKKYIDNIGDFLKNNLDKIDGFDFRWNSLISNNPLLFEDINYLKIKPYINNIITDEEKEAYKRGDLKDLYATFDNLLICNLKYYDRIITYCTMVFMHYVEIGNDIYNKKDLKLDKIPLELTLTPTKIWCAVFTNINSTSFEIKYGWGINPIFPIEGSNKSIFELSYQKLYKLPLFSKFVEICAFRLNTSGYRETLLLDETSNRKLAQVCNKFTKSSIALSDNQLESLFDYVNYLDSINKKLYLILDDCLFKMFNDKKQYSIYIFSNEFFIFSSKFSMKISKNDKGQISKEYLANSYECFSAEEFLVKSIKTQIEWAKFKLDSHYDYDKNILKNLLTNMLSKNFREIICIKRNNYDNDLNGIVSKITFSGIFNNIKIIEQFMVDNRIIKTTYKTLSKQNASKYIIDRGYFIFGIEKDILIFNEISKKSLMNHYNNYCIPVIQHMKEIITSNIFYKNDIIDFVVSGKLNPEKISKNIMYTKLSEINYKQILSKGLEYQNKQNIKNKNKKSYWSAIE